MLLLPLGGCAGALDSGWPGPWFHGSARVPAGHLPPPGECRVWYPDRPAGQQPPPGSCRALRHRVPPGAVLVRG